MSWPIREPPTQWDLAHTMQTLYLTICNKPECETKFAIERLICSEIRDDLTPSYHKPPSINVIWRIYTKYHI